MLGWWMEVWGSFEVVGGDVVELFNCVFSVLSVLNRVAWHCAA